MSTLVPPSGESTFSENPIDPDEKNDGTRPAPAEGSPQEEPNGDSTLVHLNISQSSIDIVILDVFQINVILPHHPYETQIMVSFPSPGYFSSTTQIPLGLNARTGPRPKTIYNRTSGNLPVFLFSPRI